MLPALAIDLTNQTDLVEHNKKVRTTQKHVPRCDLPAGLSVAQVGVQTPLPIHEGALRHIIIIIIMAVVSAPSFSG